jgi:hypothetical protein
VSPISTDPADTAAPGRIEAVRRRIREGYYARPEVRRTLAELLRMSLLRRGRAGVSPSSKPA